MSKENTRKSTPPASLSGTMSRRRFLGVSAAATICAAGRPARATARADITINRNFPHILIVSGIDPTTEYRPAVQNALYAAGANVPVRRGTHDFWFTYPHPAQPRFNPTPPNHFFVDNGVVPVPMRGIVDMRAVPDDLGFRTISDHLYTLVHETGHYWLSPSDLLIRRDGAPTALLTEAEIAAELSAGRTLARPALLGRGNQHWGAYFQADDSIMDGLRWERALDEGGLARWTNRVRTNRVQPPGLPVVEFGGAFNDLELTIMGLKGAASAYTETRGELYWLTPRLTAGAPMQYHTGLFLAFNRNDFVYFGFYGDHRRLRVERSGNQWRSDIADLGAGYRPLLGADRTVMLRVVRRGDQFIFQACIGNSVAAAFSGRGPFMFDGAETPSPLRQEGDFGGWQTVASLTEPAPPQAIGVVTKTWNPILCEGHFLSFETRRDGQNQALGVFPPAATLAPGADYGSLPADRLVSDAPAGGAYIRRAGAGVAVGVPYSQNYDHWNGVDQAPKLMTRAPSGNFAFGATAKVGRSLFSPAAAGAAVGTTMWGTEHSARIADVIVPARISGLWQRPPVSWRGAFIVAARDASRVTATDLQKIDVMRRYYETAMQHATGNLARIDTRLG